MRRGDPIEVSYGDGNWFAGRVEIISGNGKSLLVVLIDEDFPIITGISIDPDLGRILLLLRDSAESNEWVEIPTHHVIYTRDPEVVGGLTIQ